MLENLDYCIDQSTALEFCVSKKRNYIRHTAIAVLVDGRQIATLNYGTSQAYEDFTILKVFETLSVVSSMPAPSAVVVEDYECEEQEIAFRIAIFCIASLTAKQKMKNFIRSLLNIRMGKYHLTENNCRDYVDAATEQIRIFGSSEGAIIGARRHYEITMAKIRDEDYSYMIAGWWVIALIVSVLVRILMSEFQPKSYGKEFKVDNNILPRFKC